MEWFSISLDGSRSSHRFQISPDLEARSRKFALANLEFLRRPPRDGSRHATSNGGQNFHRSRRLTQTELKWSQLERFGVSLSRAAFFQPPVPTSSPFKSFVTEISSNLCIKILHFFSQRILKSWCNNNVYTCTDRN